MRNALFSEQEFSALNLIYEYMLVGCLLDFLSRDFDTPQNEQICFSFYKLQACRQFHIPFIETKYY
jgi:hypothetical protein